jgi:hypothetical protein
VLGANLALLGRWDGALGRWIKGSCFGRWAWTEKCMWDALAFDGGVGGEGQGEG